MALPIALLMAFLALLTRVELIGSLFGRSNARRERMTGQLNQTSEDEKAVALYCEQLLADPGLTSLQFLNLKPTLKVEDASIYLKPLDTKKSFAGPKPTTPPGPATALTQYRRMVVLGDAGTGKTTLLRSLVLESAAGRSEGLPDLPILISLPEFGRASSNLRLLDYTLKQLETRLGGRRAFLEEKLNKGQLLLLFDGLDEIQPRPDAKVDVIYHSIVEQLGRLAHKYPATSMVVTCRRAGWRGMLPDFTALELVEFGWEDIQDFIRRWMTSRRRPELIRPLATALLQNVGLRSLAATPLLLALICLVFERQGELPQRRSELYEWCVTALLTEAEARQPSQLKIEYKQALLRKVALHFHVLGQRDFQREALLGVVNPFLKELGLSKLISSEAVLTELVSEQGLLREQGEGLYGFAHLSLQEYFTAEAIAENQYYKLLPKAIGLAWWREVIVLLSGLGNTEVVLKLISQAGGSRPLPVSLACRCLSNQLPSDPDLTGAVLSEAMQLILNIGVAPEDKTLVVDALSQIKDPAVVSYFSQLFRMRDVQKFLSGDWYARVILNLVQLGFAESYPLVFQLLTRPDINPDLKQKLIDAAVIVGEPAGAIQNLGEMLPGLSGDVRAKTILLLLQRGDDSLVMPAIALLQQGEIDRNLKRRLLGALSLVLSPGAFLDDITPLLQSQALGDIGLQLRALELAVRRGGSDAIISLLKKVAIQPGRFAPELCRRLILMAGRFGEAEAVPHLLELLSGPDDNGKHIEALKKQALSAIAALATIEHTFALRHWLREAEADQYSLWVAALARSLNDQEETRRITERFFEDDHAKNRKPNRSELELELRQMAAKTKREILALPSSQANDTDYFYGWPVGSY